MALSGRTRVPQVSVERGPAGKEGRSTETIYSLNQCFGGCVALNSDSLTECWELRDRQEPLPSRSSRNISSFPGELRRLPLAPWSR